MRPISTLTLLTIWEQGLSKHPAQRALMLLAAAHPESDLQSLSKLSIGQRDELLLTLRELLFGSVLVCATDCPKCNEQIECTIKTSDIRIGSSDASSQIQSLSMDNYTVQFHLPNSEDLLAIADTQELDSARSLLISRCVHELRHHDQEISVNDASENSVNAIASRMMNMDPQADVKLDFTCPSCQHDWSEDFDITSFFCKEIDSWALRILRDVHSLASAYSWSESDILAMSPQRRQFYLDMIGGG